MSLKERKMRMQWGIVLLAMICCLAGWSGIGFAAQEAAQEKGYQTYDLGEVMVKGDKVQQKQVAIVNEVTAEQIQATNSKTVAEALSYAPGLVVTTGRKNEPNVSFHGFDQKRIQVLIDGAPYYEANYGKLDLNQIPTDNIAKIEIIKGNASVLYGSGALGGVINIITKKATTKPFTSLRLEAGDRDSQLLSLTNGMKKGIFSYWFNYSYRKTDGWNVSHAFDPKTGSITYRGGNPLSLPTTGIFEDGGLRDHSDVKANDVWLKFGIEPSNGGEYFVNLHYLNMEKGVPANIYSNSVMNYTSSTSGFSQFAQIPLYEDWGIDLDGKQKVADPLTLKMKLFYHNHRDDYESFREPEHSTLLTTSRYKDYVAGGSLLADYKAANWDTVRMSFHYKSDSHKERAAESVPFSKSLDWTGSVGLENEFTMVKNLSIIAGVSYDWFDVETAPTGENTTNDGTFNPMIGFNYAIADATKIFGSIGKKTRFPSLSELYSGNSGNDSLSAEKSINYILGLSQIFGSWGRGEVSLFFHDISDRISRDNPFNSLSIYQNFAKTEVYGFEVGGEVYPMDDLKVYADYTFNYAQDRSDGRLTNDVTNVPKHKADLGIEYRVPVVKTVLDLNGTYIGRTFSQLPTNTSATNRTLPILRTSDYFLVDGKITQPFLKYFEAYVSVKNIFDKDYEPEYGFPAAGRMFWVGLTAKY
jgi:outer membrane receptor protein involved in Fe transport